MRCRPILILCTLLVLALGMLGIGPVASGVGEHGWTVYRNGLGQLILVHIPPRASDSQTGAASGEFEPFRPLQIMPQAMASVDNRVWMVFPPTVVNERPIRRVSGVRAVRAAGGGWVLDPPELLNAGPSLTGDGQLRGFVADEQSNLHALIEHNSQWTLHTLHGDQWNTQALPAVPADQYRLLRWGSSILILTREKAGASRAFELAESGWQSVELPHLEKAWDAPVLLGHQRDLVLGLPGEDDSLEIRVLTAGSDLLVHRIKQAPSEPGSVLLTGSNTLVLVSQVPARAGQSRSVRVVEVDLNDGRELFAGKPVTPSILGSGTLRVLMLLCIAVGSVATLAAVRPKPGGVFLIPNGWSIADPSRRFTAMLIDLFALSAIIAPLFNVGILELVTGNVLARPDSGWVALPVLLVAGMISSTLLESTIGGTLGKKLLRVRVVRCTQGAAERVAFGRVLARNLIKWFLPPIAMLTIAEPGFRHRGDVAAKCIVAVRAPQPARPRGDDSEQ